MIRGLTYADGTLWALVAPETPGAAFRLLNLSVTGAELSIVDLPDTAARDLSELGHHDGSFWTIELLWPMSIADFRLRTRLVSFRP